MPIYGLVSIRCDTECCSFKEAKEDGAPKRFEFCTGKYFASGMLTPWLESKQSVRRLGNFKRDNVFYRV